MRPNPDNSLQVKLLVGNGHTEDAAKDLLQHMQLAYDAGLKEGQAQAQRFFRLALGIQEPTKGERAYWNNPVPLKE